MSHWSLKVHRLNVNDYCTVGGQRTSDCQWLGDPARAGPQTAVREESVSRGLVNGASAALSHRQNFPVTSLCTRPLSPSRSLPGLQAEEPHSLTFQPPEAPPGVTFNTSPIWDICTGVPSSSSELLPADCNATRTRFPTRHRPGNKLQASQRYARGV
ncbi:unnamed protein product [Pipistrellus nathusii]|uniref:Uncharacterized protein n=1 Tax=Pipistrellus nathusii TaxID=59473 RepID=A0ABP0A7P5_PIPNA